LSWLALAGNSLGWSRSDSAPLGEVPWAQLRVHGLLGEGASGHIYQVSDLESAQPMALKVFKGAMTSDGLPEHELAACLAVGQHAALCTPSAVVPDHPQGAAALLLPLIPPRYINLAGPPSLGSCTRDVYPPHLRISVDAASRVALTIATALAHLHQRGVMHGDLYAHNILWDPSTGDALLSDFGAATLLPLAQPEVCQALLWLEVRAFGCLLEELAARTGQSEKLLEVAHACMNEVPLQRPSMGNVALQLQ
jgi:serine/threonine protein kinase